MHSGLPPSPSSLNPKGVLARWVSTTMLFSSAVTRQEMEALPAWDLCQEQQQALPISARKTQPYFRPHWFIRPKSLWPPQPEQTTVKTGPILTATPLSGKGQGRGAKSEFDNAKWLNLLCPVRGVPACFHEKRMCHWFHCCPFCLVCHPSCASSNILASWGDLKHHQRQ